MTGPPGAASGCAEPAGHGSMSRAPRWGGPAAVGSVLLVLLALLAPAAGTVTAVGRPEGDGTGGSPRDRTLDALGRLPLGFVQVDGTAGSPRFEARGDEFAVALTAEGAMVAMGPSGRDDQGIALQLRFIGAAPDVEAVGGDRKPTSVSYFLGPDPAAWRTGLSAFASVTYRDVWPGIDAVFRGSGTGLKYEFMVWPGADPSSIRLSYAGADGLSVAPSGALLVETPLGPIEDSVPVAYQLRGGLRTGLESRFAPDQGPGATGFGFTVGGSFDPTVPLVIDPGISFSTFLGGSDPDVGLSIDVDAAGSAFVVGETSSPNFPTTPGAYDPTFNTFDEAWVAKLNPAGSALVYSTYLGGSLGDVAFGIHVDAAGNTYLAGETASSDFPATPGSYDTSYNGGEGDAWVAKLDATGSNLLYATFLGGAVVPGLLPPATPGDGAGDVWADAAGNAWVSGETKSIDFPTTAGAFDTSPNGDYDVFVSKLNPSGSSLLYSTYLGGSEADRGSRFAVDGSGRVHVTGNTRSTDFPATAGAYDNTFNGFADAFVAKFNGSASGLVYATFLGGSDLDRGEDIAVDQNGNAYVAGMTESTDLPATPGAFDTSWNGGSEDAFVAKLNPAGWNLVYCTYLGGTQGDVAWGVEVDGEGRAHVSGTTASPTFPTTPGGDTMHNGKGDAFVVQLAADGGAMFYGTFLGGRNEDEGRGLAIDANGRVYVTGIASAKFPTSNGALDRTHNGKFDGFLTKLKLT